MRVDSNGKHSTSLRFQRCTRAQEFTDGKPKAGAFSLFRSLLSKEWAKDTAKLAMWIRLIGEASYKHRTVEFSGREWDLMHGELVTTAAIMGRKLRDQDGHEKALRQ